MKQGLLITIDNDEKSDFCSVATVSDPTLIRMLEACFKTDFKKNEHVTVEIHVLDLDLEVPEEEK